MPLTKSEKIWMDGEFVDWDDAKIHVLTHTLHYGSGVFEGIRAYPTEQGPAVFRLTDHIVRLFDSAKIFLIDIPFSIEQIVDACAEFFRQKRGFRSAFYHASRSPELEEAQRRNDRDLAALLHDLLRTGYGLSEPGLETRCLIAVQVGDYLLGAAFRDNAAGDRTVLDEATRLLCRYLGL